MPCTLFESNFLSDSFSAENLVFLAKKGVGSTESNGDIMTQINGRGAQRQQRAYRIRLIGLQFFYF
jgi:hypothetical protein